MTQIRLRNSLTRKVEDFTPIDPENVRMYLCGPTVYDRAHLGNARPVVVFDVLYRLLRHVYGEGHVTYVRNFTDVDDKINATALARKEAGAEGSLEDLIRARTEETIGWYHADMDALGALRPSIKGVASEKAEPRATQYIREMIKMIEILIDKGNAYVVRDQSNNPPQDFVLFDKERDEGMHALFEVESFEEYGKLSGRSVEDMIAGARVEVAPYKRNPADFVLWKPSDEGLPGWDSPWGRGRPGWHIECSAMSYELLGASFDIHGGGIDLQFPHHENEIAQSCCAHPEGSFARYWLHNEMLQVEGKKMSKSLGNFFTVRDLLDGHDGEKGIPGEVIRFVFLQTHYTKPMDWTAEKARQAEKTLRRIAEFLGADPLTKPWIDSPYARPPQEFIDALANDLNTSLALSLVHKYLKEQDESKLIWALRLLGFDDQVLVQKFSQFEFQAFANEFSSGYRMSTHGDAAQGYAHRLDELGNRLSEIRKVAMETKDFGLVDALKVSLNEAGVEVRMSKDGVELLPGPDFDPTKLESL